MDPSSEPPVVEDASPAHQRNPLRRLIAWFLCDYDYKSQYPAINDGRVMPSLDLGLDLMRDNLNHQMSQADSIDTKAGFILGSASLITGVLVAWHKLPQGAPGVVQWLPAIAIVVYVFVVTFAALAFADRKYSLSPDPLKMRDQYVFLNDEEAKDQVFHGMVIAWLTNKKEIGIKLHWLWLAFAVFGFQIVIIAAIIITEIATINVSG